MTHFLVSWFGVLLVLGQAAPVLASVDLAVNGKNSEVVFLAVGRPSALKIRGVMKHDPAEALTGSFVVKDYKMTGTVTLKLDSLATGIGLRDRHMKEKYLETATYPNAVFTLTQLMIPRAFPQNPFLVEQEAFTGQLELHGQKVPVKGQARMEYEGRRLKLQFDFKTKVSQFKMDVPSFAGVTVADEVRVTANTEVTVPGGGVK